LVDAEILSHGIKISGLKVKNTEYFIFKHQFIQFQFADKNNVLIKFKVNNEIHAIELENANLRSDLKNLFPKFVKDNLITKMANSGKTGLFVIVAILLLTIGLTYFYLVPKTGVWASKIFPLTTEVEIGKKMAEQLEQTAKINNEKSKHLQAFANELQLNNKVKLHFKVIEDATINAFAMPGGYIYFYSGILDKIQNKQQLAAIIGHETVHVNERHSIKTIFGSLASYAIISLIFGDVSGLAAVLLENANAIQNLCYSRAFETEADEKGLSILIQNQLNPKGMIELFEILKQNNSGNNDLSFLSSHPLTDERINHINNLIGKTQFQEVHNNNLTIHFNALKN
jgi:predicted Zn-dependent protease